MEEVEEVEVARTRDKPACKPLHMWAACCTGALRRQVERVCSGLHMMAVCRLVAEAYTLSRRPASDIPSRTWAYRRASRKQVACMDVRRNSQVEPHTWSFLPACSKASCRIHVVRTLEKELRIRMSIQAVLRRL